MLGGKCVAKEIGWYYFSLNGADCLCRYSKNRKHLLMNQII